MKDCETELVVVRHGETNWNAAGRIQGLLDVPLSERGRRQARTLASRLAGPFDAFYCSDLRRTRETAAPFARRLGLSPVYDERLREWHLGDFENRTYAELQHHFERELAGFINMDPDLVIPAGESYRQFFGRSLSGVEAIVAKHPGQRLLMVSHGGVVINLLRRAKGIAIEERARFWVPNTGMVRFTLRHGAELIWEEFEADFELKSYP